MDSKNIQVRLEPLPARRWATSLLLPLIGDYPLDTRWSPLRRFYAWVRAKEKAAATLTTARWRMPQGSQQLSRLLVDRFLRHLPRQKVRSLKAATSFSRRSAAEGLFSESLP